MPTLVQFVLLLLYVLLQFQRELGLEARLVDHEVNMGGPHVVASLRAQQRADGAAQRYRIAGRLDAAEGDMPPGIGGELAAQVHVALLGVLVLVEPFGRGMPDIHLGAGSVPFRRRRHDDEAVRSNRGRQHRSAADRQRFDPRLVVEHVISEWSC